ncbi:MAG: hypothetical protein B7Z75_03725 [Acidocella sp. 20-57-95]|nr:MAG: hypothetical protein B7Z75_03725 [Acidocella sp. 20-57-95]OYV62311.1 MAG: hypothetical protein B7Z71_01740 [Acidocella sp. 21-58-7]HQT63963.1 glycosyltransferase family 39 protein [Acidocella sp.]HQU03252.1 glycosyltransferase family 39 protein [Acidocella sp.]
MELRGFGYLGVARQVNRRPVKMPAGWQIYEPWLLALAALTVLRLLVAAMLPLSPDEAYYWVWSRHLQPGYFDHPPMVAVFIRAGTAILGNTELGVRLSAPFTAAIGSYMLWNAGETLFPGRHAGLVAASLFNATLIGGVGAVIITPDTPLIFFATALIAATAKWLASRDDRWWLAIGLAAGAALLSKYTAVLIIAALGFWLLTGKSLRGVLLTPWPWAGMMLAVAVFAPNIWWNGSHGWVSYFKQGGRVAHFDFANAAQYFGELVVGQFALATPIIFGLGAYALWQLRKDRTEAARLLRWLILLPASVFVEHVISGRVQANWPAIIFAPACLAVASCAETIIHKWLAPALALGLAFGLAVYVQALAAPFPLPAQSDPTALQLSGWQDFFGQFRTPRPGFVTSDDYTTLSELAWAGPPGIPVIAAGARWHYLSLAPFTASESGLAISRHPDPACPMPIGKADRMRGDAPVMTYYLCDTVTPDDAVMMPRR